MENKIIIKNEKKGLTDIECLELVIESMKLGLVSDGKFGKQYCLGTVFTCADDSRVSIFADKTAIGAHVFTMM